LNNVNKATELPELASRNELFGFFRGYFITTRQTFATLPDLVAGYQSAACKGLCCQLTKPSQRPQPREGRSNALEYATRDQYEIPRSQITLIKKLGAGNFGEVWKGTWQGRVEVAVKTLKPGTMSPEAFLQEAEIMKKFSHPHLVAMYAVCTDQEPFYIITEFMCNGALLDFLRKEDGKGKLTFDNLISISAQVSLQDFESISVFQRPSGFSPLTFELCKQSDRATRQTV
jgi:tyrosine-protein kinase Src